MTSNDDSVAFLSCFERTVEHENWVPRDWAHLISPLLTEEAQQAYHLLLVAMAKDYNMLRAKY